MLFIEIIVGGLLAIGVLTLYRQLSDKSFKIFFAKTLILAAAIYLGFALFGLVVRTASFNWLLVEIFGLGIYLAFAYVGLKKSAMFLALGWAAHVIWDVGLHFSENVAFVPDFYPTACIGFDLVFAAYIFYRFYLSYKE